MIKLLISKFDKWWLGQIDIGPLDTSNWLWEAVIQEAAKNKAFFDRFPGCSMDMDFYIGADCAKLKEDCASVLYPIRKKQSFKVLEKIIKDTLHDNSISK